MRTDYSKMDRAALLLALRRMCDVLAVGADEDPEEVAARLVRGREHSDAACAESAGLLSIVASGLEQKGFVAGSPFVENTVAVLRRAVAVLRVDSVVSKYPRQDSAEMPESDAYAWAAQVLRPLAHAHVEVHVQQQAADLVAGALREAWARRALKTVGDSTAGVTICDGTFDWQDEDYLYTTNIRAEQCVDSVSTDVPGDKLVEAGQVSAVSGYFSKFIKVLWQALPWLTVVLVVDALKHC